MRSIFCGNLESDARQSDVERLFRKYGKVERVDMKSGFAFINMEEERDADNAIRRLDRIEFGRGGRRLRVEWTKQERGSRRPLSPKRSSARIAPSKTLFVINFDPMDTKTGDLEKHFDPYGRILNVRIRRNFAFVQYESQEDATKALEEMHLSKFMDRVISVKYAAGDNDDRRRGCDVSPDKRGRDASPSSGRRGRDASPYRRGREASLDRRGRDASPDRRGYGRGRSPDLYRRDRGSPDYGHGSVPNSRTETRGSPHYDGIAESPVIDRSRSHSPLPRERSRS